MITKGKSKAAAEGPKPRSTARMAAVQALYQMDLAGTDVADVIDEFEKLRFNGVLGDATGESDNELEGADPTFFADLLRGVVRSQRDIDPLVDQQLATGWRLVRDSVSGLMDEAVTGEMARHIREVISNNAEGAIEAHDVKTRAAGRVTFVEFHLVVPGGMTVAASHEICDRIDQNCDGRDFSMASISYAHLNWTGCRTNWLLP